MNNIRCKAAIFAGILGLCASGAALAEPYGLVNGRTADMSRSPAKSVEVGVGFGELNDVDYEHYGARFNYKFNPGTVAYADLGQSSLDGGNEADGLTFGIGGFWQMDGIFAAADFAIHASFHRVDLDFDGFNSASLSGNSIVVEGVFSGKRPVNDAGTIYFNGSLGINRQSLDVSGGGSDNETELTFSGGFVLRTQSNSGEIYGSVFFVDDLGFGAGYRYFLN